MALVEMYHGHLDSGPEDVLAGVFATKAPTVRCMVATIAFRMGIQIPDITYVLTTCLTGRRLADVAGTASLPRPYCTSLPTVQTLVNPPFHVPLIVPLPLSLFGNS